MLGFDSGTVDGEHAGGRQAIGLSGVVVVELVGARSHQRRRVHSHSLYVVGEFVVEPVSERGGELGVQGLAIDSIEAASRTMWVASVEGEAGGRRLCRRSLLRWIRRSRLGWMGRSRR